MLTQQRLASVFAILNSTKGTLPIGKDLYDSIHANGYVPSTYINKRDGYPIILLVGGHNGLSSEQEAEQIDAWINESLEKSSTLRDVIDSAKVRFIADGTETLDRLNYSATTQQYGPHWGLELSPRFWRDLGFYDNASVKAVFWSIWVHEVIRAYNQNTHPESEWAVVWSTEPLETDIYKELASNTPADDEATITVLKKDMRR